MKKSVSVLLFCLSFFEGFAQLKVANIFGDHMVLQRDKPIKIWGVNTPGEKVNGLFHGKSYSATTQSDGRWMLTLDALHEGGPFNLEISDSDETVKFSDLLMGEVWLCSGQSNMEWRLNNVDNAAAEIASAKFPTIRHIEIPKATEFKPQAEFEDRDWQVCSPETAANFTAVGYFFAKKLTQELGVPVGLVHSSWGGSHVETWISKDAMLSSEVLGEYARKMPSNWAESDQKMERKTIAWFHGSENFDIRKLNEADYLSPSYDFSSWKSINPLYQWDWKGVPSFRGTVFIQKSVEMPKAAEEIVTDMSFGQCTGDMWFYVNGRLVHQGYHEEPIEFKIPAGIWKQGANKILVKFSPNRKPEAWGVGLYGNQADYFVRVGESRISLMNGDWKARPSWDTPRTYKGWMNNEGSLLYNAMISPLIPLAIRGALWYQGESNAGRAFDYRASFPLLIKDWRKKWGEEFPFYWVQLSSFGPFNDSNSGSAWAELREAQSMTLSLPQTGEAVTIDIGNPADIHPRNKQDVGLRLALNALQNTYHTNVVGSGPRYKSMQVKGGKVYLSFDHIGSGLTTASKYGNLEGFELAGADQKFFFARSEIQGNQVVVWNPQVKSPKAVRYGWSDSPIEANLINKEGLPASPFRTDNWKGITEGKHFE